jgi:hypothetical protein
MVLGAIGFFVVIAIGFCAFAAMAVSIILRMKEPADTVAVERKPTASSRAMP